MAPKVFRLRGSSTYIFCLWEMRERERESVRGCVRRCVCLREQMYARVRARVSECGACVLCVHAACVCICVCARARVYTRGVRVWANTCAFWTICLIFPTSNSSRSSSAVVDKTLTLSGHELNAYESWLFQALHLGKSTERRGAERFRACCQLVLLHGQNITLPLYTHSLHRGHLSAFPLLLTELHERPFLKC